MPLSILSGDIQIADRMVNISAEDRRQLSGYEQGRLDKVIKLMDDTNTLRRVARGQKAAVDDSFQKEDALKFAAEFPDKFANFSPLMRELINKAQPKGSSTDTLPELLFAEFSRLTGDLPGKTQPGGSSANTLTTLTKLVNTDKRKSVDATMFGVAGHGMVSERIRGGLKEAGIKLIPETYSEAPLSATSFVFTEEGGKRSIITFPGNARKLLKPDLITPGLVKNSDVVFVQGSLWEKLDEAFPDKLLERRYNEDSGHARELWLALPTHAQFRDNMPPSRYRWLIPSADVVLSNDEELMRIYETNNLKDALHQLQEAISKRDEVLAKDRKHPHTTPPVAFVTCGKEGAMVVTPTSITPVPAPDISKHEKLFALGAGDNAYAGFLAGHVAGLTPVKSANLGMQVAGAKLGFDGARIPDPREALEKFSTTAEQLLREMDKNLAKAAGVPDFT